MNGIEWLVGIGFAPQSKITELEKKVRLKTTCSERFCLADEPEPTDYEEKYLLTPEAKIRREKVTMW